jgi:plasmid maintenance system killer protein
LRLDFADQVLRQLADDPGFRPEGWEEAEASHFRLVAQCAQAAQAVGDLHAMRILRIRSHAGDPPGVSSIQLSSSRQMLLAFGTDDSDPSVELLVLQTELEVSR